MEEQTVSVSDIAWLIGRSDRYVQMLAKEGVIQKSGHGKYRLRQTISAYISHLHNEIDRGQAEQGEDDEKADAEYQLALERMENVKKKRRENALADGLVLDAEEARHVMSEVLQLIATGLETLGPDVEREAGLTPKQYLAVQKTVDGHRDYLAEQMRRLG